MKRRIIVLLLAALLLLGLSPAALAEEDPVLIFDLYGLLEDADYALLEERAEALSAAADFNVYIVIVDDYRDYADEDSEDVARAVYEYNELGRGASMAGSLLLLSMDDQTYFIYATGSDRYTDEAMDDLGDRLIERLNEGNWGEGLNGYLADTEALLGVSTAAAATETPAAETRTAGDVRYVYDLCDLLDETEEAALQAKAEDLAARYSFGVYIVLLDDYRSYSSQRNVEDAAEDIYKANDLGYGEGKDGIMLMLSMDERDYDLCAYGYGHYAFTDYGKEWLAEQFKDDFGYDHWYSGLDDYLDGCDSLLRRAAAGDPLDVSGGSTRSRGSRYTPGAAIVIGLFVGCLVALIVCMVLRGKLKSVRKAVSAGQYVVPDSLHLSASEDMFSHVTETRVRIESDERSGGGGGTSISSGGFSHSSGKF